MPSNDGENSLQASPRPCGATLLDLLIGGDATRPACSSIRIDLAVHRDAQQDAEERGIYPHTP
eukprot:6204885-Prymnesium_polylepis.1